MKENKIFKLSLKFKKIKPGLVSLVKSIIINSGISYYEIVESGNQSVQTLSIYKKDLTEAKECLKKLKNLKIKGVSLNFKVLRNKDWLTRWKEDYIPFMITKKLKLIPFKSKSIPSRRMKSNIYLDTDIVFGNGLHPTTRFVSEFIEKKSWSINNFLDIGTGTGILSLIACKSGVEDFSCIDISRQAVDRAGKNFKRNNCSPRLLKVIDIKKFNSNKKFDFVAANLFTEELIINKKKVLSLVKKGKYLAVSGISLGNYNFFRKNFENKKMRCLRLKKEEGWVAILYKIS